MGSTHGRGRRLARHIGEAARPVRVRAVIGRIGVEVGRTLQFAAAGASISPMLVAVGYRIDTAVPALTLDHQVLYNWLTLLLSPASFLFRLTNPDAPIVPSVPSVPFAVAVSMPSAVLAGASGSSNHFSPRRGSPSERLADRYEHRLSTEQADSVLVDDPESAVLSGSSRR